MNACNERFNRTAEKIIRSAQSRISGIIQLLARAGNVLYYPAKHASTRPPKITMDAAHGEASSPLPSAIPWGVDNDYVRLREEGWEAQLAPKLLVACVEALEDWLVEWLCGRGFDFIEVGYREARNLGANLVSLGRQRVLAMKGCEQLIGQLRARGFEVFAPDLSMFTLGGGGVHCLCQALRRDAA